MSYHFPSKNGKSSSSPLANHLKKIDAPRRAPSPCASQPFELHLDSHRNRLQCIRWLVKWVWGTRTREPTNQPTNQWTNRWEFGWLDEFGWGTNKDLLGSPGEKESRFLLNMFFACEFSECPVIFVWEFKLWWVDPPNKNELNMGPTHPSRGFEGPNHQLKKLVLFLVRERWIVPRGPTTHLLPETLEKPTESVELRN